MQILNRIRWTILASMVLLLNTYSMADTPFTKIVGSAYSMKTGALLYKETHTPLEDGHYQVDYSEPNGAMFAHKKLDFSSSTLTPSFTQVNDRNGESIEVKHEEGDLTTTYQENSAAKEETGSVKLAAGMVVDAGFDGFIKQYWDALSAGKKMDVEYLVPSKQTTFTFRFSQAACVKGTQTGAVCFSLSPVSWVVKLAVDPIIVAYQPKSKRLLRFTGRANICDAQGKYENVDIQYRYL